MLFCAAILAFAYFALWNFSKQKISYCYLVKIPLNSKENESEEEYYWRTQKHLFPQTEIPDPIPKSLPNDDSIFLVSLELDGTLKINSEFNGNLQNPEILKRRLKGIFAEREKAGVFEPGNWKIVKAVVIKAPLSADYGEVVKVIDTVKESGADPIVLQIDELPR